MPFPTQFPTSAMQHLVAELTGAGAEPVAQLVEDAYDVLGYGLFIGFRMDERPPMKIAVIHELDDDQKAELLKDAMHPQATSIPWDLILPIVMDLLKKWLGG